MGSSLSAPNPGQSPERLEVFRVAEDTQEILRVLEYPVKGVLTHWINRRSEYCPGDGRCPPSQHNKGSLWKGYAFAHRWVESQQRWKEVVLEVTEYLEVDFREKLQPGQCWEISRAKGNPKKHYPTVGVFHSEPEPGSQFRVKPVLPVVRNFYHCPTLNFTVVNPMPSRIVCDVIDAIAPRFKLPEPDVQKPSEEQIRRLKERILTFGKGVAL